MPACVYIYKMKKINKADFCYIKWQKVTNNISDTELKYQINEINIIYSSYISCGFLKSDLNYCQKQTNIKKLRFHLFKDFGEKLSKRKLSYFLKIG